MKTDMNINLIKKKYIKYLSPNKVLMLLYLILLLIIIALYKCLPFSPILLFDSIPQSDWSHKPISCWDSLLIDEVNTKECSQDAVKGNILLFGDSHAQQLVFGFQKMNKNIDTNKSKKLIFLTSKLMQGNWRSSSFREDPQVKYIQSKLAKTTESDVIVFSITSGHLEDSVYGKLIQKDRLQVDLFKLLKSIFYRQPIKGKILLMLDTPHLENNVSRICSDSQRVNAKLCKLKFVDYMRQNNLLQNTYDNFKELNKNDRLKLKIINPMSLFCKLEVCSLFDDKGFMLIDGNHIKMSVSQKLVESFLIDEI